jgi:imidazolonepropionase-like amidohydrolase
MHPVFGVTGVRDMNDSFPQMQTWRQRIAAGELIGPRIIAAGPYLVGGRPPIPHLMTMTAEEGRAGVDSVRRLGVDFVKVHNGLPRDAYFAIAKRVKELGWTFAGHVPQSITVAEAADAGQKSLEHLTGLPNACTAADSAALRPTGLLTFLLGTCTSADLGPTIERLKVNGTAIDPTLTVFGNLTGEPSPVDSMDKYLSAGLRQLQSVVMRIPPMPAEAKATAKLLLGKRRELVGRLHQAGIPVLTGSDAPTPGTFPGISLHEELEELVAAGMPPAAVVAAATIGAARYLGLADSLGTVAVGRLADLVLVEGDPLRDIRNTRRIAAVWIDGRWLGDAERRQILTRAEAAARSQ